MQQSKKKVNLHLEKELFRTLHQAITDLKTPQEAEEFLRAFLTRAEHAALAKRIAVAYWLDKGRGYNNIRDNLKVSSATIAGIQSQFKNSAGIQIALQKIKAEEWANQWAEKIKRFTKLGK